MIPEGDFCGAGGDDGDESDGFLAAEDALPAVSELKCCLFPHLLTFPPDLTALPLKPPALFPKELALLNCETGGFAGEDTELGFLFIATAAEPAPPLELES
jgi:hypothetical protein